MAELLSPAEAALWRRMSGPDRRHAVAVARRAAAGSPCPRPPGQRPAPGERAGPGDRGQRRYDLPPVPGGDAAVLLVAALLHDVGKVEARLGTLARVGATMSALVLGRSRVAALADRRGLVGRVGRYTVHDRLGAALLREAGSQALVVSWAAQHHLPRERWDIPPGVGAVLKAADDD